MTLPSLPFTSRGQPTSVACATASGAAMSRIAARMERIAKDYSPLELSAKRFAFHCPGHPDSMSRARLGWLFGIALVLAGFVPVLVFTLGSLLPGAEASALLGVFPDLS